MVSDPEAVKDVFTAPPEVAPSAAGNSPVAPVMGPSSVIVLTGPEHLRQRKLLLPPFHGERMREYEDVIVEATRATWRAGRSGGRCGCSARTRAITLEVILRAVFGVEAERMAAAARGDRGTARSRCSTLAILLLALRRPSLERPDRARSGAALDRLDAVVYEELARRRAQQRPGTSARTSCRC